MLTVTIQIPNKEARLTREHFFMQLLSPSPSNDRNLLTCQNSVANSLVQNRHQVCRQLETLQINKVLQVGMWRGEVLGYLMMLIVIIL
jgi:hypothetical protein